MNSEKGNARAGICAEETTKIRAFGTRSCKFGIGECKKRNARYRRLFGDASSARHKRVTLENVAKRTFTGAFDLIALRNDARLFYRAKVRIRCSRALVG